MVNSQSVLKMPRLLHLLLVLFAVVFVTAMEEGSDRKAPFLGRPAPVAEGPVPNPAADLDADASTYYTGYYARHGWNGGYGWGRNGWNGGYGWGRVGWLGRGWNGW